MTAVAYERLYWWRSNSYDLSSPHQPPAASRLRHLPSHLLHRLTPLAAHIKKSNSDSAGYNNIQFGETSIPVNCYQSRLSRAIFSPKYPITYRSRKPVIPYIWGKEVEPIVSAHPRMHAPGNLNVGPVEEISFGRKVSSNISIEASNPLRQPARSPYSASCPHTPTNLTCQDNHPITNTSTTTAIYPRTLSTSTNAIADSTNQNSCSWLLKNFSKLNSNSNSRGSLSSKNKGGCPRRRLTDEDGYIRRAACICVNKEETKVLLVSSKKDPCVWLVPGGGLEAGEDACTAAKREAWEEAGIQGHIARYLGMFESCHHSGVKKHRTAVYILVVTEEHSDFPEATLGRRRQWFTLEEALLHLARNRPLQSAYLQLLMMSKLKVADAS